MKKRYEIVHKFLFQRGEARDKNKGEQVSERNGSESQAPAVSLPSSIGSRFSSLPAWKRPVYEEAFKQLFLHQLLRSMQCDFSYLLDHLIEEQYNNTLMALKGIYTKFCKSQDPNIRYKLTDWEHCDLQDVRITYNDLFYLRNKARDVFDNSYTNYFKKMEKLFAPLLVKKMSAVYKESNQSGLEGNDPFGLANYQYIGYEFTSKLLKKCTESHNLYCEMETAGPFTQSELYWLAFQRLDDLVKFISMLPAMVLLEIISEDRNHGLPEYLTRYKDHIGKEVMEAVQRNEEYFIKEFEKKYKITLNRSELLSNPSSILKFDSNNLLPSSLLEDAAKNKQHLLKLGQKLFKDLDKKLKEPFDRLVDLLYANNKYSLWESQGPSDLSKVNLELSKASYSKRLNSDMIQKGLCNALDLGPKPPHHFFFCTHPKLKDTCQLGGEEHKGENPISQKLS